MNHIDSIKFSIVVPTYNRADIISRTVESVLNQTYKNLELIIVDDGSTDNTDEVIKAIQDDRIRYYKITNSERAFARNYGIKHSTGHYITFLDSDDIYYENYLQNAVGLIEKKKDVKFFHLAYECINTSGQVIYEYKQYQPADLYKGNFLSCIGVFVRKDITENNLFNEDRNLSGSEDYEYWLRLYARFGLEVSDKLSAAMIFHPQRGEFNLHDSKKLVKRITTLLDLIKQDREKKKAFSSIEYGKMFSFLYIFLAIHLVKINHRMESIKFFIKCIGSNPLIFLNYYFYSYLFNLLINNNAKPGFFKKVRKR